MYIDSVVSLTMVLIDDHSEIHVVHTAGQRMLRTMIFNRILDTLIFKRMVMKTEMECSVNFQMEMKMADLMNEVIASAFITK